MSRKRQRFKEDKVDSVERKIEKKEQENEKYDAFEFLKNKKQTAAVAGVFFVIGFIMSMAVTPQMDGMIISNHVDTDVDALGNQGVDFLNAYFVEDGGVTFVSAEEEGDLVMVTTNYQDSDIPIHMTKDGKFIILSGIGAINMEEYGEQVDTQEPVTTEPVETGVPKTDKPVVNTFIMSYCPYGLQMEKALIPVLDLLGDEADIKVNFVNYVMHGEKEIIENNHQYCIQRDQSDKLVDYLTCFVQSDDHEGCMTEAGVDKATMDACITEIDEEFNISEMFADTSTWSNGRYPQYNVDGTLAIQYEVRGSPTLVINGQTVSVNRSPEAIKQAVCNAFTTPPEECSTVLSTAAEGPGIGALGNGSAASGSEATCE
jgi:glutaredoxin